MNPKFAQRRNLFNKVFQTFNVSRHLHPNAALKYIEKIDEEVREIAMYHGLKKTSLKKDLSSANNYLFSGEPRILESFNCISNFKNATVEIKEVLKKLDLVPHMYPVPSAVTKSASFRDKELEFERMYRPVLEKMNLTNKKDSFLIKLLDEANNFNTQIAKMFEELDNALTAGDVKEYCNIAEEYFPKQKKFEDLFNDIYHNHIIKMIELRAKKHRGIGDVIETSRDMSEDLLDRKFEACPCGSGRAYMACHGFSDRKVKNIMEKENLPYDKAEKRHYDIANFLEAGKAYRRHLKENG